MTAPKRSGFQTLVQTRHKVWFALRISGIALLAAASCRVVYGEFGPPLIFNSTASEPRGIYWLSAAPAGGPARGELVVLAFPPRYEPLALERKWVMPGRPLLKGVGAVPGDLVCIGDTRIAINHKDVGPVLRVDSKGRPLPQIEGCTVVARGSFLPLSTYIPNSFDGRYMGAQPNSLIRGIAHPLWTF